MEKVEIHGVHCLKIVSLTYVDQIFTVSLNCQNITVDSKEVIAVRLRDLYRIIQDSSKEI